MIHPIYVVLLCSGLFLTACTETNSTPPQIHQAKPADTVIALVKPQIKQEKPIDEPFENVKIGFQKFKCKGDQAKRITLSTGSVINIPARAFQNQGGEIVDGAVEVRYREFHSLADIMLSGITMVYETDGELQDFESAGMFEIRAFAEDEVLTLRPNKSIKVDLASYKSGDFNHYALNESEKKWTFIEKGKVKRNQGKTERIAENDTLRKALKPACEIAPQRYQEGDDVFDLNYSFSEHSTLDLMFGAMWRIKGGEAAVSAFRADRKRYNEFEILPHDSCNTYKINFWHQQENGRIDDTSHYLAQPVWKGKLHDEVSQSYRSKVKAFNQQVAELAKARKRLAKEANLLRSFELKNMGIFNCDRVIDYLRVVPLALVLKYKDKVLSWWYLTQDKSIAIKYYSPNISSFKYYPDEVNGAIAVLPNGKLGTITDAQFKQAYQAYMAGSGENKTMEIDFTELSEPMTNRDDFAANVSSL